MTKLTLDVVRGTLAHYGDPLGGDRDRLLDRLFGLLEIASITERDHLRLHWPVQVAAFEDWQRSGPEMFRALAKAQIDVLEDGLDIPAPPVVDPRPMWNEVVGNHPHWGHICDIQSCVFKPRPEYSHDRADYGGWV